MRFLDLSYFSGLAQRACGGDWHFERAQTWENLLAAHEKWLLDFNYQHHFAHEHREDGCHSPAAVLGWVKGMQPAPERIYCAFSAVGEMRTITKAGYVRFRDYLLYGERNLAGKRALVNLFPISSKMS